MGEGGTRGRRRRRRRRHAGPSSAPETWREYPQIEAFRQAVAGRGAKRERDMLAGRKRPIHKKLGVAALQELEKQIPRAGGVYRKGIKTLRVLDKQTRCKLTNDLGTKLITEEEKHSINEWRDFIDDTHTCIQDVIDRAKKVVMELSHSAQQTELSLMEQEDVLSQHAMQRFAVMEEEKRLRKLKRQQAQTERRQAKQAAREAQQVAREARRLAREQAEQARLERERAEAAQLALDIEEREAAALARQKKLALLRKVAGVSKAFNNQVDIAEQKREQKRELAKLELQEERMRRHEEELMRQAEADQREWERIQLQKQQAKETKRARAETEAMSREDNRSHLLLKHSRFVDICRSKMAHEASQSVDANRFWATERARERFEAKNMEREDECSATRYREAWELEDERNAEYAAGVAMGELDAERKGEELVEALFCAEMTARGDLQTLVAEFSEQLDDDLRRSFVVRPLSVIHAMLVAPWIRAGSSTSSGENLANEFSLSIEFAGQVQCCFAHYSNSSLDKTAQAGDALFWQNQSFHFDGGALNEDSRRCWFTLRFREIELGTCSFDVLRGLESSASRRNMKCSLALLPPFRSFEHRRAGSGTIMKQFMKHAQPLVSSLCDTQRAYYSDLETQMENKRDESSFGEYAISIFAPYGAFKVGGDFCNVQLETVQVGQLETGSAELGITTSLSFPGPPPSSFDGSEWLRLHFSLKGHKKETSVRFYAWCLVDASKNLALPDGQCLTVSVAWVPPTETERQELARVALEKKANDDARHLRVHANRIQRVCRRFLSRRRLLQKLALRYGEDTQDGWKVYVDFAFKKKAQCYYAHVDSPQIFYEPDRKSHTKYMQAVRKERNVRRKTLLVKALTSLNENGHLTNGKLKASLARLMISEQQKLKQPRQAKELAQRADPQSLQHAIGIYRNILATKGRGALDFKSFCAQARAYVDVWHAFGYFQDSQRTKEVIRHLSPLQASFQAWSQALKEPQGSDWACWSAQDFESCINVLLAFRKFKRAKHILSKYCELYETIGKPHKARRFAEIESAVLLHLGDAQKASRAIFRALEVNTLGRHEHRMYESDYMVQLTLSQEMAHKQFVEKQSLASNPTSPKQDEDATARCKQNKEMRLKTKLDESMSGAYECFWRQVNPNGTEFRLSKHKSPEMWWNDPNTWLLLAERYFDRDAFLLAFHAFSRALALSSVTRPDEMLSPKMLARFCMCANMVGENEQAEYAAESMVQRALVARESSFEQAALQASIKIWEAYTKRGHAFAQNRAAVAKHASVLKQTRQRVMRANLKNWRTFLQIVRQERMDAAIAIQTRARMRRDAKLVACSKRQRSQAMEMGKAAINRMRSALLFATFQSWRKRAERTRRVREYLLRKMSQALRQTFKDWQQAYFDAKVLRMKAAVCIQHAVRSFAFRKRVHRHIIAQRAEKARLRFFYRNILENSASRIITRAIREYCKHKRAARNKPEVMVQMLFRMRKARDNFRQHKVAIVKIQALVRGFLCRRRARLVFQQNFEKAFRAFFTGQLASQTKRKTSPSLAPLVLPSGGKPKKERSKKKKRATPNRVELPSLELRDMDILPPGTTPYFGSPKLQASYVLPNISQVALQSPRSPCSAGSPREPSSPLEKRRGLQRLDQRIEQCKFS